MTTATTTRIARLLASGLRATAIGFWITMVLAVAVVGTAVNRMAAVDHSAWDWISVAPRYVLLTLGVLVAIQLPQYVNHGVTRRDFVRGALTFLVPLACAFAVLTAVVAGVEAWAYDRLRWVAAVNETHLYDSGRQVVMVLGEHLPVQVAYAGSGLLIGLSYLRWRAWATLALPVTALPFVLTESLMRTGREAWLRRWLGDLTTAGALPVVALVLAALCLAVVVVAREVRVRAG